MKELKKFFMHESTFAGNLSLVFIPVCEDAPYQLAIYSPSEDVLYITSKNCNDGFILNNQYNADGSFKMIKGRSDASTLVPALKQEKIRRPIELEVTDRKYIKNLIELITVNYDESVLTHMFTIADNLKKHRNNELLNQEIIQPEQPPLVSNSGLITVNK